MPSSPMFSDMDNKILKNIELLNSDYIKSLDTFAEGFINKMDDEVDEEFSDEVDEVDEDDKTEGMKSKSKTPPDPELIPQIDTINYLIRKAGGSSKDVSIAKKILTMLFTAFLSFLIAHNWYSNYFTHPIKERLSTLFSSLQDNQFTHYMSTYIVQLVTNIDEYVMVTIPTKIRDFITSSSYFGKRTVFYAFLSVSLGMVPYFLGQVYAILEYIRREINKIANVIRKSGANASAIKTYFRDLVNNIFNQIFLFKGDPFLSSILGISYVMVFISNIVADQTKGIFENVFSIIPSSLTKLAAGNIFYLIYIIFKFAMFYQPTIAFSSFIITVYIFYYSIMKTGITKMYALYEENDKHMNDGRVAFKTELFANFKNGIENFLKVITNNFHEIYFFFSIRQHFPDMFTLSNIYLKMLFIGPGIMSILKLIYRVLSKYGIGVEEAESVKNGISEINSNIDLYNYVETKFEKEEDPKSAKEHFFANMFDRIYNPYKTA